jgi:hypothetical protein
MTVLADIAPRLAAARDAWLVLERRRDVVVRTEIGNVQRLEGLVAHRDLQLIRAGAARRSGSYLAERRRKLDQAEQALSRARRRLDRALEAGR